VGTVRIGVAKSGPSTEFFMEADWVRQDWAGNYSVLGVWLRARNTGNSSSFLNNYGEQVTWWGGGELGRHAGQPFLPGGYANGATRWHDYWEHRFYHDGNGFLGGVDFGMRLTYGNFNESHYGNIGAPGRIPKPPTAPRNLQVADVTPISAGVSYAGPADWRGSTPAGYIADWYEINGSSNPRIWSDLNSNGYTNPAGPGIELKPGTTYHVYIYARSNVGNSPAAQIALTTDAGGRIKFGGQWRNASPWIKVNGVWRRSRPSLKQNGAFRTVR
jgi:hypothetical protein